MKREQACHPCFFAFHLNRPVTSAVPRCKEGGRLPPIRRGETLLDPSAIVQGVASGIITQKAMQATDDIGSKITGKDGFPSDTQRMIMLLEKIIQVLEPQEKFNDDIPMALQPYPLEYPIDEQWYGHAHICILFGTATPLRMDIEGIGTYNKTVGPGWVQLDVRGRISTTDSLAHTCIVSYRDDALGAGI